MDNVSRGRMPENTRAKNGNGKLSKSLLDRISGERTLGSGNRVLNGKSSRVDSQVSRNSGSSENQATEDRTI